MKHINPHEPLKSIIIPPRVAVVGCPICLSVCLSVCLCKRTKHMYEIFGHMIYTCIFSCFCCMCVFVSVVTATNTCACTHTDTNMMFMISRHTDCLPLYTGCIHVHLQYACEDQTQDVTTYKTAVSTCTSIYPVR